MRRLLILLLLLVFGLLGATAAWVNHGLSLAEPTVDVSIEPGTSPKGVAQALVAAGVQTSPDWLYGLFRFSGQARLIKAGSYEFVAGITPWQLLKQLVHGEETLTQVTLVEGWTFKQFRQALAQETGLRHDTLALDVTAIMAKLDRPGQHPEGRFYPDTYSIAKGSTDLALLRRAMRAMDQHLASAWAQRAETSVLRSPEQALILASLIEKETGRVSDRAMIASVFHNRLRLGMLLQTDPSVIYGLGDAFDGNLRRSDLQTDTPWNSYTRPGLPPTPIAMPGKAALLAAVKPASSQALYFVARGDGSSQFSDNLAAHNRAVNKYQRGK